MPARRATVWAWLGFIVPVVSFWFPYQVAADCTPHGDPARRLVAWWWALWICQALVPSPLAVLSYFASRPVAVVLAMLLCVVPVAAAMKGREMIAAILATHRRILTIEPARH
ncbi:MAG: DUF4328 domain-containing protein [Actinomycetota bacterium]|nr:DUF4328 domain-containing protein [Actinomycetota bacterium]